MSLYMIQFDGQPDYVEADSLYQAVEAWRVHIKINCQCEGIEEPESITLVHDQPVVRARP